MRSKQAKTLRGIEEYSEGGLRGRRTGSSNLREEFGGPPAEPRRNLDVLEWFLLRISHGGHRVFLASLSNWEATMNQADREDGRLGTPSPSVPLFPGPRAALPDRIAASCRPSDHAAWKCSGVSCTPIKGGAGFAPRRNAPHVRARDLRRATRSGPTEGHMTVRGRPTPGVTVCAGSFCANASRLRRRSNTA
jgi:hypothetical protein